jgi:N-acetylneuraminic acid mutarotase
VAFQDRLVIAGGLYEPDGGTSFIALDDVSAATVAADGTLGGWTVIGHLPSPGYGCLFATTGDTLVLLGGLFTDDTLDGNVWTAKLGGDGQLETWQQVGELPYQRRPLGPAAAVRGSTLWLTDSRLDSESDAGAQAVVASATLSTSLGAWNLVQYWPQFRGQPLGAFTADAVFVMGGADDTGTLTDVTALTLDSTTPVSTTALPAPRTYGAAVSADDWLFAVGGRVNYLGGPAVDTVYSAQELDGGVGAWTAQATMPAPRSNHTATVVGDWLFVAGGSDNAPGQDTLYRARVKHAQP